MYCVGKMGPMCTACMLWVPLQQAGLPHGATCSCTAVGSQRRVVPGLCATSPVRAVCARIQAVSVLVRSVITALLLGGAGRGQQQQDRPLGLLLQFSEWSIS
jgi:hypothetical protein